MALIHEPTNIQEHVTTRDGQPVMLFAYLKNQQRSYLGAYYNKDSWVGCSWLKDGTYLGNSGTCGLDLVLLKNLLKGTK